MKKFLQTIFCHKTIDVIDAPTGQKQKATYIMLFGFQLNIIYKNS
ncbi:hypothetical protein [Chryseobacterium cucumeris]